ncbi:MAG: efflux RND transporter periplasmic adaptor subunit [Acidobacteriia bacterium]|nr:efflux RND transporter periplasmic adaptor subunit [Terriglobia bacterium]
MIAFLAIVYCVGLYLVFIKFRLLPFNLPAQIICGMVGFIGLLTILFGMNYTQPFSVALVVSEYTTPVVARVPGRVTEVLVQNNTPVKKGDVLFKMDPQPYVDGVRVAEAGLAQADVQTQNAIRQASNGVQAATANTQAIEAAIRATQSATEATKAHLALATTRLKEYTTLASKNAGSQFEVERYDTDVNSLTEQVAAQQQQVAAQQQQLAAAKAQLAQATAALEAARTVRPATLAQFRSQVESAHWNLEQTTVYAPEDGYVTQLQLQPGAMASMTPVMVFVYAKHRTLLSATLMQNYVNTFKPGAEAEVAFPALPGRILKAKVTSIELGTKSGQLDPSGQLEATRMILPPDRMLVRLNLEDALQGSLLPVGTSGFVAIRGDSARELFIIRQVIMRWYTWTNYLFAGY